ncbi:MAG TPA: helicase-associated domain-containing protein [Chthonomonadaceae bacterium]|nr:helicase-associated domain-containing protein [Chthonomonadaceae bacterium]
MASFAEALYSLATPRLRNLVQLRNVSSKKMALIPDKRSLAQFLAGELNRPDSVAGAVLQCNARELRLLQLSVAHETGRSLGWRALVEMAGGSGLEPVLSAVMTRLEDLGLAFRVGVEVFVPDTVRYQVPASLSDRHSLPRLLNMYDAAAVKRIVDNLSLHPPQSTKPVNIEAISKLLLESGEELSRRVPLTQEELEVVMYLVQAGGSAPPTEVAMNALNGKTEDFFRYEWQNRWKQGRERNAIDRLLAKGLVYVVMQGYGYNLMLVIPGDLLRALVGNKDTAFWTAPPPAPTPLAKPPAATTRQTATIRDVVTLFGFLGAQEAARTNTGHIHKAALKNIARLLSTPDERYAAFLYAICRDAGLIAPEGEKQVYTLTPKGNSWLHWDSLAQQRALFDAWRNGITWGEMFSEPLKKSSDYRSAPGAVAIRNAVLDLVKTPVGDAFVDMETLVQALTFRAPLLLVKSATLGGDLVPSPVTFVRLLICECLAWLGLVELGWETPPQPQDAATRAPGARGRPAELTQKPPVPEASGYRLTPLGGLFLDVPGSEPPQPEPREDKFIVQANSEIFVPPYLEPATLYHLLLLTDIPAKGATGNTVSITRESIRRMLDLGESAKDMLGFLQAHARTGIPQNVEYLINEVGGKHGHIHIGKAQMYVQVDSPLLLKEMQARRELKDYFVRTLTDTVALLKADDPEKLLRELRKAGYLPVSDDAPRVGALHSRVRSAPAETKATPTTEAKSNTRAAKADTSLDWERIARDDNAAWGAKSARPVSIARPENAIENKEIIRFMLTKAARDHQVVEVVYQARDTDPPSRHLLQPQRVTGNYVEAYCQIEDEDVTLNTNRIAWARLVKSPSDNW